MRGDLRISSTGDVVRASGDVEDRRRDLGEVKCWDLVGLTDGTGRPLCSPACPLLEAAASGRATSSSRPAFAGGELVNVVSDTHVNSSGLGMVIHVLADVAAHEDLTPREDVVLALLCDGMTNRQIGDALGVKEATIRSHVQHILAKLPAANRVEAVVRAYRGTTKL